ncbi:hypothetical protein EDB19DRAFT_1741784, partial [Suillus lakei]
MMSSLWLLRPSSSPLLHAQELILCLPTLFFKHLSTAHHCCRIAAMRLFTKPGDFWSHQGLLYSSLQIGYKTA